MTSTRLLLCAAVLPALVWAPGAQADHEPAGAPAGESGPFPPEDPIPAPSVDGTARDGETLTASRGGWTGLPDVSHRWIRCDALGGACAFVHGADNQATLVLSATDVNKTFRIRVSRSSGIPPLDGSNEVDSGLTGPVSGIAPSPTAAAVIGGLAAQGETLHLLQDATFSGTGPIEKAREWLRCPANGGACASTGVFGTAYRLRAADVGTQITLRVRGTGPDGQFAEVDSAPSKTVKGPDTDVSGTDAAPRLLRPFPTVVIEGLAYPRGATVSQLTVFGPRGARVAARCRGEGCPVRQVRRRLRRGKLRLRALEANLPFGTVIEIRVTKRETIGKFTRIRIRRGRPPARTDLCLEPDRRRPVRCPKAAR